MNEPLRPDKILQTGLAFWPSKTLLSAIELDLFTELAGGPQARHPDQQDADHDFGLAQVRRGAGAGRGLRLRSVPGAT